MSYDCDKCGACCKHLIIEIDWVDVQREPLLRAVTEPFRIPLGMHLEDEDGEPVSNPDPYMAGAMLACGSQCPMLGAENLCTIYPTRPTCCVGFEAGGKKCQEARAAKGLALLLPKETA